MTKQEKTNIKPFTRQFYRGNVGCLILAVLGLLLDTGVNLMISWLIQQLVDMTTGLDTGFTFSQVAIMTALALAVNGASYGIACASRPRFTTRGIGQYKEYVFEKLCGKGISAFSGENSALYISALSNDAESVELNYLGNIFVIIYNVMLLCGGLAMMFYYSPLLSIISIALSVFPLLASLLTGNLVAKAEKTVSDRNETYTATLKDCLMGFSVIKAFRAEVRMCRLFAGKVREVSDAKCLRKKMTLLVSMFSSCAGFIVQLGVFLIGTYLALRGSALSPGSILVFIQLLNYVINPIGTVPQALAEMKAARALIVKIARALEDNVREEGLVSKSSLTDSITLRDLSFGYEPEKPVLQNIDFTFEAGKSYAIVGGSGSGKSTLLNLLMASHDGYTGTVSYDGTELRSISSESLYELVSLVQQNVFIFNASIRDNITMFSDFPEEEVRRAMALSGLSALVAERGESYLCGENGSGLSGGEKQRISIARSLLKKSQVLLVDEATAALDARTAFQVSGAILDLAGLTRIVVTHALDENLLERYDSVLALKNGRIAESGSFGELMEKKGYFYSLFTVSQA